MVKLPLEMNIKSPRRYVYKTNYKKKKITKNEKHQQINENTIEETNLNQKKLTSIGIGSYKVTPFW